MLTSQAFPYFKNIYLSYLINEKSFLIIVLISAFKFSPLAEDFMYKQP